MAIGSLNSQELFVTMVTKIKMKCDALYDSYKIQPLDQISWCNKEASQVLEATNERKIQ